MALPIPLVSSYAFRGLVDELDRRGLPIPDEVRHGYSLMTALDEAMQPPAVGSLISLSAPEIVELAQRATAYRVSSEQFKDTATHYATAISVELQQVMRENLDPILDALRGPFDKAGAAVHAAVQAGVLPGMRAPEAIMLPQKGVKAWQDLPDHLNMLEDVAQLRLQIVNTLDAAPFVDRWDQDAARHYEACFTSSGQPWAGSDPMETPWDRWLRLCRYEAVHLATAAETQANAEAFAAGPTYVASTSTTTTAELHNLNAGRLDLGGDPDAEADGRVLSRAY